MKALKLHHYTLAFVGTLMFGLPGCTDAGTEPTAAKPAAAKEADKHEHPTEGPHHGHLVELGKEEFHAELVHDKSVITIYLLDSAAKAAVAIDAKNLVINLKHDGKPEQFELAASPDAGDAEGKSSRFKIDNAELAEHLEHADSEARLSVTINGNPYSASLAHSHDEHEHNHDH